MRHNELTWHGKGLITLQALGVKDTDLYHNYCILTIQRIQSKTGVLIYELQIKNRIVETEECINNKPNAQTGKPNPNSTVK